MKIGCKYNNIRFLNSLKNIQFRDVTCTISVKYSLENERTRSVVCMQAKIVVLISFILAP